MKKMLGALMLVMCAIGCGHSMTGSTPASETPKLFIYNLTTAERNPGFSVDDGIRLAANVSKTDVFQLCYIFESTLGIEQGCNQDTGTGENFSAFGTWHIDYPLTPVFTGKWTQWIIVNGAESNRVTYSVGQ